MPLKIDVQKDKIKELKEILEGLEEFEKVYNRYKSLIEKAEKLGLVKFSQRISGPSGYNTSHFENVIQESGEGHISVRSQREDTDCPTDVTQLDDVNYVFDSSLEDYVRHLSKEDLEELAELNRGVCLQCGKKLRNIELHYALKVGDIRYFDKFTAYCDECGWMEMRSKSNEFLGFALVGEIISYDKNAVTVRVYRVCSTRPYGYIIEYNKTTDTMKISPTEEVNYLDITLQHNIREKVLEFCLRFVGLYEVIVLEDQIALIRRLGAELPE
jgi:hypothetical protein